MCARCSPQSTKLGQSNFAAVEVESMTTDDAAAASLESKVVEVGVDRDGRGTRLLDR